MILKRIRLAPGYTALEAVFLLIALAVLAMTSLAVYQKKEADTAVTRTSSVQPAKSPGPAAPSPTKSAEVKR